ncbi:MAG: L-threonylcarbamoyladenylate synthase, partial [Planctomycetota bacterium]
MSSGCGGAARFGEPRNGGTVAFPTETVYGLGADARNAAAVAKVFEAKGRPRFDPLIVHTADADAAWSLVDRERVPEAARPLPGAFWPGPLTLVLPKTEAVPGIVTAGLETVGVRVPGHAVARRLIAEIGGVLPGALPGAVAAPSANRFGGISPTRAEHVSV